MVSKLQSCNLECYELDNKVLRLFVTNSLLVTKPSSVPNLLLVSKFYSAIGYVPLSTREPRNNISIYVVASFAVHLCTAKHSSQLLR